MDKRSPLTWNVTPRTDSWNHQYQRPASAVAVVNEAPKFLVSSRCAPHVNAVPWPPKKPIEDYSWIRTATPQAGQLPPEHPMSPERLREAAKQAEAAILAQLASEGIVVPDRRSGTSKVSGFSRDNPNNSSFNTKGSKKGKQDGAFGKVDKFTAHRMGGHYSSPTKTLLEVTRKDEIELQKQRDIAEAKAKFLLSGGKLLPSSTGGASSLPRDASVSSTPRLSP
jgi:hypothetical protein